MTLDHDVVQPVKKHVSPRALDATILKQLGAFILRQMTMLQIRQVGGIVANVFRRFSLVNIRDALWNGLVQIVKRRYQLKNNKISCALIK